MTRFARAKGSKASNERLPEEATPWSEMKKQLLEKNKEIEGSQKRKDALEKRNANYKAFLEEKEKDDMKNSQWAEFPGSSVSKTQKTKKSKHIKFSSSSNTSEKPNPETSKAENEDPKQRLLNESDSDEPPEEQSSKKEIQEPVAIKKKKVPKRKLKITLNKESEKIAIDHEENSKPVKKRKSTDNMEGLNKKIKKQVKDNGVDSLKSKKSDGNKQKEKIVKENLSEQDVKKIEKKKQRRIKQVEKKEQVKAELKRQKEEMKIKAETETEVNNSEEKTDSVDSKSFVESLNTIVLPKKPISRSNNFIEEKKKKMKDGEHVRRKPLLPHKMFVNGKELEIDYVDGFPVKKEDALRLKKLRGEMISKGLPRSEINIALKLERRKAEKAFAREKKKVCFHCRKSGHNLSECPNLDKNELVQTATSGICFKCGSTEHTHFECKVVRGQEFKFATCFICKEQGHIARQCPDNARGLYPKGGACKVCGDVTHLKKDCPKYQAQQQKQEENMRLETLGKSNPDVLDDNANNGGVKSINKRPNKIIKF